jgi:hypothetical protein
VKLKLSDNVVCPKCNKKLVATFSPLAKTLLLLFLIIDSIISIGVAVIAASINFPFFHKWIITGFILLGIIILSIIAIVFLMNRLASLHSK